MSAADLRLPWGKYSPSDNNASKENSDDLVVEKCEVVKYPVDLPRSIVRPYPNYKHEVNDL